MWKLIILSAFLSVVQGANINELYGNYTVTMVYSNLLSEGRDGPAMCLTLSISEDPRNVKCSCADGKDTTLVQFTMLQRIPIHLTGPGLNIVPVLAVDNVSDVASLKNVTCDCAVKEFNVRTVAKNINENYVLVHENTPELNEERAVLLARTLPSNAELEHDVTVIDEIKDKKGLRVCTREIREEEELKLKKKSE